MHTPITFPTIRISSAAATLLMMACPATARAGLEITASPTPMSPPAGDPSLIASHLDDSPGGNTSLRFMDHHKISPNKYPVDGVTVFAKAERFQARRDRDLGQTFLTKNEPAVLDRLFLRIGHADLAMLDDAPGARVAVQWFEVKGVPRLNDHGTPGFLGKFDRKSAPEMDDYIEGETYLPLRVVEGRLPGHLRPGDYLLFDFTGSDEFRLEANRNYAFLLMFLDHGEHRGMTLANLYYGSYRPDPANPLRGHGIRREGNPAFPRDWKLRLQQPPETLGFPDVCTFRDLYFAIAVK